jgi:hypothetical protein
MIVPSNLVRRQRDRCGPILTHSEPPGDRHSVAINNQDRTWVHTFLRPGPPVLTRLRLLMTSVLREMGRGRPCSFRKRPQALQRTEPDSSRRHKGVVLVEQFWQTGCDTVSDAHVFIIIAGKIDMRSLSITRSPYRRRLLVESNRGVQQRNKR